MKLQAQDFLFVMNTLGRLYLFFDEPAAVRRYILQIPPDVEKMFRDHFDKCTQCQKFKQYAKIHAWPDGPRVEATGILAEAEQVVGRGSHYFLKEALADEPPAQQDDPECVSAIRRYYLAFTLHVDDLLKVFAEGVKP